MYKIVAFSIFSLIVYTGYTLTHFYPPSDPIKVVLQDKKIQYKDVQTILDKRCVTCHSCYNSPCQAKFSSFEGLDRGGSKERVYGTRILIADEPSRLFIDAKTSEGWRDKGFFSLTFNDAKEGYNNSILGQMISRIDTKQVYEKEYDAEDKNMVCAQEGGEVTQFRKQRKHSQMPFGFPRLKQNEYNTLMQWLAQGAVGPSALADKALKTPSAKVQEEIKQWEDFLNQDDAKHKMTARYLYEHYFLAHINFQKDPNEFYSLIRSSTPSPLKPETLTTLRPYDKPEQDKFYYRFEKIHSTIVHKTHMVVRFDAAELARIKELFIEPKWLEEPHLMSYDDKIKSNAFLIYAQIPPVSRYKFLLDHSEYIVRTFIRGPICKGNIALSVIRDHFWIVFQNPEYDIGANSPEFLRQQSQNLRLPTERGSSMVSGWMFESFGEDYRNKYRRYYDAKMKKNLEFYPDGMPIESIWKGEKASDAPVLTAYRHFDSGSVRKGVLGELPKTIWLIDYALLERIYYTLVAGFDVYGTVSHQMEVRSYMDFFRLEAELNYLSYLPSKDRDSLLDEYYQGEGVFKEIEMKYTAKIRAQHHFKTPRVKQEFMEFLVDNHFSKETNIQFDTINYFRMGESAPPLPEHYHGNADLMQGLRSLTAEGNGFIQSMTGVGVNLAFVRVKMKNTKDLRGSFIVNRWHDNVNSYNKEAKTFNAKKDTLDIVEGSLGSYPNVFFVVDEEDLPDFFDMIKNFKPNARYWEKAKKYAISRSDENFWEHFDWFQEQFKKDKPLEAGLYDLNRYYKQTW